MTLEKLKELKNNSKYADEYKNYEIITNLIAMASEQNSSDAITINPINPVPPIKLNNKGNALSDDSIKNQFGSLCTVRNYLSHNHHTTDRIYFCPDVLSRIKTDFSSFIDKGENNLVLNFIFPSMKSDANNTNIDVKIIYILLIIMQSPYRSVYFNPILLALESYYNTRKNNYGECIDAFNACKFALSNYYNKLNKYVMSDLNFKFFVHEAFANDSYHFGRVKDDNWTKNFMDYAFNFLCSKDFFKDICTEEYYDRDNKPLPRPKYKTITRLNAIYFNKITDENLTYIASMAFLQRALLLFLTDEAKFKLGDTQFYTHQKEYESNPKALKPNVLAMVSDGWTKLARLPNDLNVDRLSNIKKRSIKTNMAKLVWRYLHRLDDDMPIKTDDLLSNEEYDLHLAKTFTYKTAKKYEYRAFIEQIVGVDFNSPYSIYQVLNSNPTIKNKFEACLTAFCLDKGDFSFNDFYKAMCQSIIYNPKLFDKNNLADTYSNKNLVYKLPVIDEVALISKLTVSDINEFANSNSVVKSKVLAILKNYNDKVVNNRESSKTKIAIAKDEKKLYYRALENVSVYMAYKKSHANSKDVDGSTASANSKATKPPIYKHENLALKDSNGRLSYLSTIDLGFTIGGNNSVYIINKEHGFLPNYIAKPDNIRHLKTFLQEQIDNKNGYKLADRNDKHMLSQKTRSDGNTIYIMEENFFTVYLQYLAGLFAQIYRFECAVLKGKKIDPKIVFLSFNKVLAVDTFLDKHCNKDKLIKCRDSIAHVNIVNVADLKSAEYVINNWYKQKNIKKSVNFKAKYCRNLLRSNKL